MKYLFGAVYVLVLATQLPHVWHSYAALERPDFALAHVTALGAAVAFELSTGVFTFRVVRGSRRRWTRVGLGFFIVASVVANAYYYGWWRWAFDWLMPVFATVALPAALALFAEEFAAESKREERKGKRAVTEPATEPAVAVALPAEPDPLPWRCEKCPNAYATQQQLAGHIGQAHRNGKVKHAETLEAIAK